MVVVCTTTWDDPHMIRRRGDEPGMPMDGSIDWIGLDWTGSDLHFCAPAEILFAVLLLCTPPGVPGDDDRVLGWCWSVTFTGDLFTWKEVWFFGRMLSD